MSSAKPNEPIYVLIAGRDQEPLLNEVAKQSESIVHFRALATKVLGEEPLVLSKSEAATGKSSGGLFEVVLGEGAGKPDFSGAAIEYESDRGDEITQEIDVSSSIPPNPKDVAEGLNKNVDEIIEQLREGVEMYRNLEGDYHTAKHKIDQAFQSLSNTLTTIFHMLPDASTEIRDIHAKHFEHLCQKTDMLGLFSDGTDMLGERDLPYSIHSLVLSIVACNK